MRVQLDSRYPIDITVSVRDFGRHFVAMNSLEQVAVIRVIIEGMKEHPTQWDYIAIELENPDNADLASKIRDLVQTYDVIK